MMMKASLQQQPMYCSRDHNYPSRQWYKFQSYMMICFWENSFGAKTSLSFVFTGPAYPEVFRQITMVQVSKLYDDPFMRKHILA